MDNRQYHVRGAGGAVEHRGELAVFQGVPNVLGRAALLVVRGHHADFRGAELRIRADAGAEGGDATCRRGGAAAVQCAADGLRRELRSDGDVAHDGEVAV